MGDRCGDPLSLGIAQTLAFDLAMSYWTLHEDWMNSQLDKTQSRIHIQHPYGCKGNDIVCTLTEMISVVHDDDKMHNRFVPEVVGEAGNKIGTYLMEIFDHGSPQNPSLEEFLHLPAFFLQYEDRLLRWSRCCTVRRMALAIVSDVVNPRIEGKLAHTLSLEYQHTIQENFPIEHH